MNITMHSSTGFMPDGFLSEEVMEMNINRELKPYRGLRQYRQERIKIAREILKRTAEKRRKQFDKTSITPQYNVGN